MYKQVTKEIEKLEKQKIRNEKKKKQLEEDIVSINAKLKSLHSIKTQYEKLQSEASHFFPSADSQSENSESPDANVLK